MLPDDVTITGVKQIISNTTRIHFYARYDIYIQERKTFM